MVLGDNLHTGIILTKKSPKSTTLIGKDSIYRTKVIVRKPVWTPAIHNHIIRPRLETGVLKGCTRLAAAMDKDYQLLAHGRWFSPGTPASSTTKTGRHDIAEILLKVTLNTKNKNQITSSHITG